MHKITHLSLKLATHLKMHSFRPQFKLMFYIKRICYSVLVKSEISYEAENAGHRTQMQTRGDKLK